MAANFCWMPSSLLASLDVIEFQTADTFSLDLSKVIYNLCMHSKGEKVNVLLRSRRKSLIKRENIWLTWLWKWTLESRNTQVFNNNNNSIKVNIIMIICLIVNTEWVFGFQKDQEFRDHLTYSLALKKDTPPWSDWSKIFSKVKARTLT
jgi:hypothetical protein